MPTMKVMRMASPKGGVKNKPGISIATPNGKTFLIMVLVANCGERFTA